MEGPSCRPGAAQPSPGAPRHPLGGAAQQQALLPLQVLRVSSTRAAFPLHRPTTLGHRSSTRSSCFNLSSGNCAEPFLEVSKRSVFPIIQPGDNLPSMRKGHEGQYPLQREALDPLLNRITPYLYVLTLWTVHNITSLTKTASLPLFTFHKESGFNDWGSLKGCNGGSQIKPAPQMSLEYESLAMFISRFCYAKCTPGRAHLHRAAVNQGRRLWLGGTTWWDKAQQKGAINKVFGLGKVICSNTLSDDKPVLLSLWLEFMFKIEWHKYIGKICNACFTQRFVKWRCKWLLPLEKGIHSHLHSGHDSQFSTGRQWVILDVLHPVSLSHGD